MRLTPVPADAAPPEPAKPARVSFAKGAAPGEPGQPEKSTRESEGGDPEGESGTDRHPDPRTEPALPADPAVPLHRPDPYGTPPYGQPGPYAPAPPVQHPMHLQQQAFAQLQAEPHQQAPWHRPATWEGPPPAALHQSPPPEGRRPKRSRGRLLVGAVLLTLIAGLSGGLAGGYIRDEGVFGVELPQAPAQDEGRAPESVAGIAEATLPGVVYIHVRGQGGQGTGTGFVLDRRGHILTNNHVIAPAAKDGEISVTFNDGKARKAEVVGGDGGYDLAVLKVDRGPELHPLRLGNSDSVRVGDPVVAIGAPYDLEGTVTSGIISAKDRPITAGGGRPGSDVSYVNALQTDAPINPGNSGGPLVNARGEVIGINTAIRSAGGGPFGEEGQGGSIGLGFAIPINQGKRVAEELINTGRATHPVIGVQVDLRYDGDGAKVSERGDGTREPVTPGGPADDAGIEPGDVITAVDGKPVRSGEELIVRIRSRKPGDTMRLTVRRDGREQQVDVTLSAASGD